MLDDFEWDQTKLKIFDGPLYSLGIASATVTSSAGSKATITCNPTLYEEEPAKPSFLPAGSLFIQNAAKFSVLARLREKYGIAK
jgi:hypothetical protein